ncbi:MAG: phage terminase large subunit family protein [Phycisphaerae bacterium]|nr:phage terminase large subunit family protein [Phycisphaerae bacterium]
MAATKTIWSKEERQAWDTPAPTTVSQWADTNRMLPSTSAEHGQWRTDRAPYLRDIMDAFTDPEVEEITITGPAQCGKTEAVFNMIGYTVDVNPAPTLYVTGRDEDCENISTERLLPTFRDSPALSRHFTKHCRDIKIGRVFQFDTMPLYFTGSQSAMGMASRAIGVLACDETDKWPKYVGREGSPAKLAYRRGTTFPDFKVIYLCTLTTADGFIWISLNDSNMQRYWIPCPLCGRYFDPSFGNLKVDPPGLRDPEIIIKDECVYYECNVCAGHIEQHHKTDMVAAGKWVPRGQIIDAKGNIIGKPRRGKRHTGFWIDGLISPWILWHRMLAEFFEAQNKEEIAPEVLREFRNQVLSQIHEESGRKVSRSEMDEHKGQSSRGTVPDWVLILVAGADYHEDERHMIRIDYEVRGFGYGMRNCVVSSGSATNFDQLEDEVLLSPFPWEDGTLNEEKPWLPVVCMFVDSGFMEDRVFDFCMKYPGLVFPTKGASGEQRAPIVASAMERISDVRAKKYRGMQLFMIDTGFFKDRVTTWVSRPAGSPGSTEFYIEIPDRYFKDFCNEHKIKIRDKYGQETWRWVPVSKGAKTHHLDTAVLAAAAAHYKRVHILYGRDPKVKVERRAAAAGLKKKIVLSELQRQKRLR